MALITLHTTIDAPCERCFLLSLSIDLHMSSTAKTNERAVAGITSGLMNLHDTVTWKARHLGFTQHLTSRITAYDKPYRFVDEMSKGIFKSLHHEHLFKETGDGRTYMTDVFEFHAPLGMLGKAAEVLFLTAYLKRFINERNQFIKQVAESKDWERYLVHTGAQKISE